MDTPDKDGDLDSREGAGIVDRKVAPMESPERQENVKPAKVTPGAHVGGVHNSKGPDDVDD